MKIDLNNKEKFWFIAIGIAVFTIPIMLTQFPAIISFNNTGEIGDTIGGITAPFLSFFGSILIYLALRSQITANEEFKRQFEKQNQDMLFFRLIDNLKERTLSYSVFPVNSLNNTTDDEKEIQGVEATHFFVQRFKTLLNNQCLSYGKYLISKTPSLIDEQYYSRLEHVTSRRMERDFELGAKLKQTIIQISDDNDRWEYIKSLGTHLYNYKEVNQVYIDIGSVYWYKTDFKKRKEIYSEVFSILFKDYGGYLESFLNDYRNVLIYVGSIEKNESYALQLRNSLTAHEKTIVFYFLSSLDNRAEEVILTKEFKVLDSLVGKSTFFIDLPSPEEFKRELNSLLN